MKIRLDHSLAYVEVALTFRGQSLRLRDTMDYGFPADGILGLDYLLRIGALIDLRRLELRL